MNIKMLDEPLPDDSQSRPVYLVALIEAPDGALKFKHPCRDSADILKAVRNLCTMIGWDPEEHYDDSFWTDVADTQRLDGDGVVGYVELYGSGLLADMIIGRVKNVYEASRQFAKAFEEEPNGPEKDS